MIDAAAFAAIRLAGETLAKRTPDYDQRERYYDGDHVLPFATQRWRNVYGRIFERLRDNLCLPTGSLVVTPTGLRPIEDMQPGDQVIGHDGRGHAVLAASSRSVGEEIVGFRTYGSPQAWMTAEHPVWATRQATMVPISAKYARPGEHVRCYGLRPNTAYRIDSVQREWIPAGELQPGDIVWATVPSQAGADKLSEGMKRLLGWYLAEGSVSDNGRVAFTFHEDEAEYQAEVAQLLRAECGVRHVTQVRSGAGSRAIQVVTYSKRLARHLVQLGGRGSAGKRISPMLLDSQEDLTALLAALWAGDGYIGRGQAVWTTVSPLLAQQVQTALLRLGIVPGWRTRPARIDSNAIPHRQAYDLRVSGAQAQQLGRLFGTVVQAGSYRKAPTGLLLDGMVGYAVAEVSRQYYGGLVHNLEVAEVNSYMLPGQVAVHNCPLVVDALVARLRVDGFGVEQPPRADGTTLSPGDAERAGQTGRQRAADVWASNRMDAVQNELHEEASKLGDAYVIVWPDLDTGRACIEPNDPRTIYIHYDAERPSRKLWAAKRWREGKRLRATLYFADRIEKYITVGSVSEGQEPKQASAWQPYAVLLDVQAELVTNRAGQPMLDADGEPLTHEVEVWEPWPVENPYDQVPVFHYRNRGKTGGCGRSELDRVIPLQDALNKQLMDLLVTAEVAGYPQRYATGLASEMDPDTGQERELPFKPGVDQFWKLFGEQVQLGQFPAADLAPGVAALTDTRTEIGRVSQTPPYMMFMVTGEIPSGEALKVVDAPFNAKVEHRQTTWGNVHEDMMALAVLMDSAGEIQVRLSAEWANTQPHSAKEEAETYIHWKSLGIPERVIWRRMGFTEQECDEMEQANAKAAEQAAARGPALGPDGQPIPGVTPPQLRPYAVATARTRPNGETEPQGGQRE